MLVKFNLKMLRLHICENTIMQVEEECRQTIFYLKGYSYPKLYYNKMNINQKPTANTVSSTKRKTLRWMRGEIYKLMFIKVIVYLPFLFEKNLN